MIAWQRQGAAIVGTVTLATGRTGKAVVVAARDNPKGAMIIAPGANPGEMRPVPLRDQLDALEPTAVIEILCMQERVFGSAPLPPPDSI
jgi:hypothetical protein